MKGKILWIDDEIENLKSLIYFLEEEGYIIDTVSNGEDAIEMLKEEKYNIIFLDEYMHGFDGIETLNLIREISYNLPVVMITKSEDTNIMDSALSERVDDYLIKPVSPKQLLATLKKFLNKKETINRFLGKNYTLSMNKINNMLLEEESFEKYYKIHHLLSLWNLNINRNMETDILSMHEMQKEQVNEAFIKFVKRNYVDWIKGNNAPVLSHTLLDNYIVPLLKENKKVFFLLIDCFRYDHYLLIETFLQEYFDTYLSYYYSIIPTATPYSRNAIFSGMLPLEIYNSYREKWSFADSDSQNQFEEFFLKRKIKISLNIEDVSYNKVSMNEYLKKYISEFNKLDNKKMNALVINMMDVFTHFRSNSKILKDMLPDENSLLAFVSTWFRTSGLIDFFKHLINKDYTIVITSDHGSIISKKALEMETGKDVSINLKYKFGSSIKAKDKSIFVIDNPQEYGLPIPKKTDKWYIAEGNGYLVYSTKFNQYKKEYYNTFQHGGISMEEMIMSIGIIRGKNA